jgi:hypothetical protein
VNKTAITSRRKPRGSPAGFPSRIIVASSNPINPPATYDDVRTSNRPPKTRLRAYFASVYGLAEPDKSSPMTVVPAGASKLLTFHLCGAASNLIRNIFSYGGQEWRIGS